MPPSLSDVSERFQHNCAMWNIVDLRIQIRLVYTMTQQFEAFERYLELHLLLVKNGRLSSIRPVESEQSKKLMFMKIVILIASSLNYPNLLQSKLKWSFFIIIIWSHIQLHVQFVLWSGPLKTKLFHKRFWLKMFTLIETKIKTCAQIMKDRKRKDKKREIYEHVSILSGQFYYITWLIHEILCKWSLAQFQSYVVFFSLLILCKIAMKSNETKWKVTQVLKSIRQARTPSTIFVAQNW